MSIIGGEIQTGGSAAFIIIYGIAVDVDPGGHQRQEQLVMSIATDLVPRIVIKYPLFSAKIAVLSHLLPGQDGGECGEVVFNGGIVQFLLPSRHFGLPYYNSRLSVDALKTKAILGAKWAYLRDAVVKYL